MHTSFEAVLRLWFGQLDALGRADDEHAKAWWKKDDELDARIREQFEGEHRAVRAGERDEWLVEPRGRLAAIIVLDQFSRNMFRGTAEMYASDAQALRLSREGIERGHDRQLVHHERAFSYMPFMHSEQLDDQDRCIALFSAMRAESPEELHADLDRNLASARQHRDIVARFGCFPHRNALLGRASTPQQVAFLSQPGSSF